MTMLSESGSEIVVMEAQPWTNLDPRIDSYLGYSRDKVSFVYIFL